MAKGKIEINSEACKSCQYCVISCPKKILVVGEEVNSFGYPYVISAEPGKSASDVRCVRRFAPEAAIEVWR